MINRRDFLKGLVATTAGLYVPKTLYFDMKPRYPADTIEFIREIIPEMIAHNITHCGMQIKDDEFVRITYKINCGHWISCHEKKYVRSQLRG